jgi:CheY-like chemotaxis protein
LGESPRPDGRRLVLLVDNDVEARRHARHLLELRGVDVVQASNGMAALELIQRLPRSFRMVLMDLDLPGVPGPVVVETLRLFRPDLPVFCMCAVKAGSEAAEIRRCLAKPLRDDALGAALAEGVDGWTPREAGRVPEAAAARAKACFAAGGDLVEAALELARGGAAANEAG